MRRRWASDGGVNERFQHEADLISASPCRGCRALADYGRKILWLAMIIVAVILLMSSTTSVPTGNVGVLTLFGRVTGETLNEGIHLINPLKAVQKLSVQTQSMKESANVPSNEGLILALDTSLLFRLDRSMAARCIRSIGDNYAEKIVEPTLRAAIRASTSAHTANALYTNARELVQQQIQEELNGAAGVARGDRGKRAAPRRAIAGHAKGLDRSEATGGTGCVAHELHPAERESRKPSANGSKPRVSRTSRRIVAQGISTATAGMERHRSDGETGDEHESKVVIIGNPKNGLPLVLETAITRMQEARRQMVGRD